VIDKIGSVPADVDEVGSVYHKGIESACGYGRRRRKREICLTRHIESVIVAIEEQKSREPRLEC